MIWLQKHLPDVGFLLAHCGVAGARRRSKLAGVDGPVGLAIDTGEHDAPAKESLLEKRVRGLT